MRHIDYNQPAWGQINNEYLLNGKIFLSEMNMTKQIYVYFQRRIIQQLADTIFIQLPFIDIRVITIICFGVFPGGSVVKIRLQCRSCRRHRIDLQVGKIPWRRAWQPIPVFLPGESHGQKSLAGYSPQGHKKLYTTEATQHVCAHFICFRYVLFIILLILSNPVSPPPHFTEKGRVIMDRKWQLWIQIHLWQLGCYLLQKHKADSFP